MPRDRCRKMCTLCFYFVVEPMHICAYVYKATGYIEDDELTKVNTTYPELLLEFYSRSSKRRGISKQGCRGGKR